MGRGQDFEKSYLFDRDRDHMIPLQIVGGNGEYLIAGTEGKSKGNISLMKIASNGNVLFNKVFSESNTEKTVVDFIEMNGDYYIVCLRRQVGVKDKIELITVNTSGTIITDRLIEGPGSDCLFPIHAMVDGQDIYICGYRTEAPTSPPNTPKLVANDYSTPKSGFILKYTGGAVTNLSYFNSTAYFNGNNNSLANYDNAVNMKIINGDLYVTGSCNVVRPSMYMASYGPAAFTSGSFVTRMDANTLNPNMGGIHATPYTMPSGLDYMWGEHGFDFKEKNSVLYLFGNYFYAYCQTGGCTLPSGSLLPSVVPHPTFYHITALDINSPILEPMGSGNNSRWQFGGFDYAWGLQTLPSLTGGDIKMSGMMVWLGATNCISLLPPYSPYFDYYYAFHQDLTLDWDMPSMSINITPNATRTYFTQVGTGSHLLSNSYYATSDWLYNNTWSANNACNSPNGISLTAPVWNLNNNKLAFKLIQANSAGDLNTCTSAYTDCFSDNSLNFDEDIIYHFPFTYTNPITGIPGTFNVSPTWAQISGSLVTTGYNISTDKSYSIEDCQINNYYRQAITHEATTASILPNPANEEISIQIDGIANSVHVYLLDILGRKVADIYEGTIIENTQKVKLPILPNGIYSVLIELNGKRLPSQKLAIQH